VLLTFVAIRSWSIQLRHQDVPACHHGQVSVTPLALLGDVPAEPLRASRGFPAGRAPVRCDEAA